MSVDELSPHEKIAKNETRDEHGHFVHKETLIQSPPEQPHLNPVSQFLHDETVIHKTNNDELVDLRIGNPLKKITSLLEDIKHQKAFSFTLKGSLGIMGVVLVAGTFGILGGSRALCDKGVQTKIGTVKILHYQDPYSQTWLDKIPFLNTMLPKNTINRTLLLTPDNKVVHLALPPVSTAQTISSPVSNTRYFVTGKYDWCGEELTVESFSHIEPDL